VYIWTLSGLIVIVAPITPFPFSVFSDTRNPVAHNVSASIWAEETCGVKKLRAPKTIVLAIKGLKPFLTAGWAVAVPEKSMANARKRETFTRIALSAE
jgi:hypothetical protein